MLRPQPFGIFMVCVLTAVGGIYLFFRHDTIYDWLVGALMLAASCLVVSGCLWRHYTVVTAEGVTHADWWGFRRRSLPMSDILSITGASINTSMGILKPVLQLTIQTQHDTQIKITADIYSERAFQHAFQIIHSCSPSLSPELQTRLKVG